MNNISLILLNLIHSNQRRIMCTGNFSNGSVQQNAVYFLGYPTQIFRKEGKNYLWPAVIRIAGRTLSSRDSSIRCQDHLTIQFSEEKGAKT